jgi:hypothetical protein
MAKPAPKPSCCVAMVKVERAVCVVLPAYFTPDRNRPSRPLDTYERLAPPPCAHSSLADN